MSVPYSCVNQDLDLGVVGNSAIAALIDKQASVTWMCLPRLDGDPAFCSLLGAGTQPGDGAWGMRLVDQASCSQRYVRNTAILETELIDKDGNHARVTDFAPRFRRNGRIFCGATVVRIIEPLRGSPRLISALRPRYNYGADLPHCSRGTNHIRYLLGPQTLRLSTDAPVDYILKETPFLLDRPIAFVLGSDESLNDSPMAVARVFLRETRHYWWNWVRNLSLPADYQEVVIRAAITLKLCSYEETGGIVAALTSSIPEYGASGRTWDYRYCWLRDSYFTVRALNSLSATRTMENYLHYVSNLVAASSDGYMQPLFGLGLERHIDEFSVPELVGYRGLGPVRRGNAAYSQVQNDGYGSIILAAIQRFFDRRLPEMGDEAFFRRLERLGAEAEQRWDQPDAGIWEFRSRSEVHTHSAVMCWAACDRLARIANFLGLKESSAYWFRTATRIHAGIIEHSWNEQRQSFVATFEGTDVDASLLLMAQSGFISPTDPRYLMTLAACEAELRYGNHLYRYRRPDDFGPPETAFTACTFWMIDALVRVGRHDEAAEIFADVLTRRNHLGLLSEGIHVETGALWGNFPQSYSMVGLINAATSLSRAWEEIL